MNFQSDLPYMRFYHISSFEMAAHTSTHPLGLEPNLTNLAASSLWLALFAVGIRW
jgi:hypothetical protein